MLFTLDAVDNFQKDSIFLRWSILTHNYSKTLDDNGRCAEVSCGHGSAECHDKVKVTGTIVWPRFGFPTAASRIALNASDDWDYKKKLYSDLRICRIWEIRLTKIYKGNLTKVPKIISLFGLRTICGTGGRQLRYRSKWEYHFKKWTACWPLLELSNSRQPSHCSDTLMCAPLRVTEAIRSLLFIGESRFYSKHKTWMSAPLEAEPDGVQSGDVWGAPITRFLLSLLLFKSLIPSSGNANWNAIASEFLGPKWQALGELSSHLLKQGPIICSLQGSKAVYIGVRG